MAEVFIICGPAATGKSTIVSELVKKYNAFFFRPCDSFFKLGKERGISTNEVFDKISDKEAGIEYKKVCLEHDMIICDQHMAIQYEKDTKIASGDNMAINSDEKYTAAISKEFIQEVLNDNIKVYVICLYATPEILFNRAVSRNKESGFVIRNTTISMVEEEIENELLFYQKFINDNFIEGVLMDTSNLNKEEVLNNVVQKIEEFRGKKKFTFKWSK